MMFANNANLFTPDKSLNTIFIKANLEPQNMNEWFKANKLSLNMKR